MNISIAFKKLNILRIALFIIISLLFSSCTKHSSEKYYDVVILDKTKILQDSTIKKISSYKYPTGYFYMIRTVDSVDIREIGNIANDYFSDDKHKHPHYGDFYDRGVYIFISKNPALIQIRTGCEIRLLANWNGIISGKEYINIQKIAMKGDLDKAALSLIDYTATAFPERCNMSKIKREIFEHFDIFNDITTFLSSFFDFSKLSPDAFYSQKVLKPIFEFHLKIGSIWVSFILLFTLLFLTIYVVNTLLFRVILYKLPRAFTNSGRYLLSNIITIAIFVPAINSRGMLVGSRMEDRLKLEFLNINGFENYVFPDVGGVNTTSWWLAILFVVIFYLNKIPGIVSLSMYATLKRETQLKYYKLFKKDNPVEAWFIEARLSLLTKGGIDYYMEYEPYDFMYERYVMTNLLGGVFLGLSFWLFMPMSFTVVSIYLLIITTIIGFGTLLINAFRGILPEGKKKSDSDEV